MEKFFGAAEPFGKEHFLPLANHAVALVVEQNRFQRQVVVGDGLHLTDIHPKTAVAIDVDDEPVRTRKLSTDRSGKTKSHRAH